MQSLAEMVNPGGTGRPRFAISARPAPLPPRMSRIAAEPSARPSPNEYTHRSSAGTADQLGITARSGARSEEHTSELQSHSDLVCRLLLEKKKKKKKRSKETKRRK